VTDQSLFERLARSDNAGLDAIFRRSPPPEYEQLVGYQWRGWNTDPNLRYLGLRKFIKAFFRGEYGEEGCNVRVAQSDLSEPWRQLLRNGRIRPYAFYAVGAQTTATRQPANPRALLLDYGASARNPWWHIERRIRDYLVRPSADEPDVMLGRAWLGFGTVRFASSFFVIERFAEFDPANTEPVLVEPDRRRPMN
jgi:hypothetical protein